MTTKKNSIITSTMKKAREIKQTEAKEEFTPEQEAFMSGGDTDLVANKKEQTEKKGRGRPTSNIKKRKVTFDLPVELITELDKVANFYGMNRAQFVSQAVMKAVREVKRTENL